MIGGSHQGAGLHDLDSHFKSLFFPSSEFIGSNPSVDRSIFGTWLEVLPQSQNVQSDLGQIKQGLLISSFFSPRPSIMPDLMGNLAAWLVSTLRLPRMRQFSELVLQAFYGFQVMVEKVGLASKTMSRLSKSPLKSGTNTSMAVSGLRCLTARWWLPNFGSAIRQVVALRK